MSPIFNVEIKAKDRKHSYILIQFVPLKIRAFIASVLSSILLLRTKEDRGRRERVKRSEHKMRELLWRAQSETLLDDPLRSFIWKQGVGSKNSLLTVVKYQKRPSTPEIRRNLHFLHT